MILCVQVQVDRAAARQQNPKAAEQGKGLIRTVFPSPLVWLLPSSVLPSFSYSILSFPPSSPVRCMHWSSMLET